jgi:hypothetical protein
MFDKNRISALSAFAAAVLLSACASAPAGHEKQEAALKTFEPKSEAAGLYVVRSESAAAFLSMVVEVDGKPMAKTSSQSFAYLELAPGKHVITSKAENVDSLELNVEAGKLYYVLQETKPGNFYVRSKLRLVDEAEGQQGVKVSKLALAK